LGKRGKFEKLERNDAYFEIHGEETDGINKTKEKPSAKKKLSGIFNINSEKVPEKMNPPSRFTYKKEKRTVVKDGTKSETVLPPPMAPLVLMASVTVLVLIANIIMSGKGFSALNYEKSSTIKMVVMALVYLVPACIYVFSSRDRRRWYNICAFSPSALSIAAAGLGLVTCLTLLQKYFIVYTFSYSDLQAVPPGNTVLAILAGAVVPAICEEVFVRGILQYEISKYAGGITGILSCSVVFAVLHFDLQFFTVYLAAGLVLGALTHVTHSVFPAMIVHFLNNTISILLSNKLTYIALWRISGTLLMIILASLCFVFLILFLRRAELMSRKRAAAYLASKPKDKESKDDMAEDGRKNVDEGGKSKQNERKKIVSEPDDARYFTCPKGNTPERFGRIMLSPFTVGVLLLFVIVVVVKLNS